MNRHPRDDHRWSGTRLGVLLLTFALIGGCGSSPEFLLDSDVPIPGGSSGQATFGIKRADGLLIGVDTVFATNIDDPMGVIDTLAARFEAAGWGLESRERTVSTATAVFVQGERRCRVRVVRNELDPDMSRIAYNLWTVADDDRGSRKVDG